MKKMSSALASFALAFSLCFTGCPVLALADADAEPVESDLLYMVDTNWGFYYTTYSDGTAEITGSNGAEGETSIDLPDTVTPAESSTSTDTDSYTITSIVGAASAAANDGKDALFYTTRSSLEQVSLPSQLVDLGAFSFYGCNKIESISIPASVWAIEDNCFRTCSSLKCVDFQGKYMGYLGNSAFRSCTSLEEFAIPALLRTGSGSDYNYLALGGYCFGGCTALKNVYFLAGNPSGTTLYNNANTANYSPISIFNSCDNLESLVFFTTSNNFRGNAAGPTVSSTDGVPQYYSIDFFASEEEYQAAMTTVIGGDGVTYDYFDTSGACACATYAASTSVDDILNNPDAVAQDAFAGSSLLGIPASDLAPDAKQATGQNDMTWALSDSMFSMPDSTLSDYCYAVPTSRYNLDYALVQVASSYTLKGENVLDLSGVEVCSSDSVVLDAENYELACYKLVTYFEPTMSGGSTLGYYPYDDPEYPGTLVGLDGIAEEGMYSIVATAQGSQASGKRVATFQVITDTESIISYSSKYSNAAQNALLSLDVSESIDENVSFNVVVDSSDWQAALIASGLAGVGNGAVVCTENGEISNAALRAINATRAPEAIILESVAGTISSDVEDALAGISSLSDGYIDRFSGTSSTASASAEDLSLSVYKTVGTAYDFGSIAVIASSTNCYSTACAARLASQEGAAVFLTDKQGSLSSSAISTIGKGGFERLVVVGDTGQVTSACQTSLESACSLVAERILDTPSSAFEKSVEVAESIQGGAITDISNIVVVEGTDAASVIAASVSATRLDGVLFVVISTADEKAVQEYIQDLGRKNMSAAYSIGLGDAFTSRLESIYTDSPEASDLVAGDTIEYRGLLFVLQDDMTLSFSRAVTDTITSTLSFTSLTYRGKTYTVNSFVYTPSTTTSPTKTAGKSLKAQSIKVKPAKKTVKAKLVKHKSKALTFKVTGAKGKLVAKAAKKAKKSLKVKTKGKKKVKITLKKGTKKGTYKVKVYAKKTSTYKQSATKTITIKVK